LRFPCVSAGRYNVALVVRYCCAGLTAILLVIGVFGSERLIGALLDRLTHHVHILEMNGDSHRLKQSRRKRESSARH
jgi:hypothetical protein